MTEQVVCTCSNAGREGFMRDTSVGDDPETDLWVHVTCGKPTRLFFEAYLKELGFYDTETPAPVG